MTAAEQVEESVRLRRGTTQDADFVFDSWLKSYRDNNAEMRAVPRDVYFSMQRLRIASLLEKSSTVVACAPDAEWQVMGWAVVGQHSAQGVLHYLYVKQLYRGFDLTAALCAPLRGRVRWFSHRTPKLERVAQKLGLTFNPYLAGETP